MYLLDEQDPSWRWMSGSKREAPEPDARQQIDRFLKLFRLDSHDFGISKRAYTTRLSELNKETYNETLRAIGGATLSGQRADWLFDGLAINLIASVFDSYEGYFGARNFEFFEAGGARGVFSNKFKAPQDLCHALTDAASLVTWIELPRDGLFAKTHRIPLKMDGKKGELIFVAHILGDRNFTLSEVRINLRHSSQLYDLRRANDKLNEIVEDLHRRTALAKAYLDAPEAAGMPAELRARLKAILEENGIPNGSYSRTGFSSGPFPYERTALKVKDSGQKLVFHRCTHCANVKALTIEDTVWDELPKSIASEELEGWHSSVCEAALAAASAPAPVRFQPPEFMALAGPRKGHPGRVSVAEKMQSSLG